MRGRRGPERARKPHEFGRQSKCGATIKRRYRAVADARTGTGRTGDMIDLKPTLQALLQDAGYETWFVAIDQYEIVAFEDDAAMGFACVFESGEVLLKEWKSLETKFLMNF